MREMLKSFNPANGEVVGEVPVSSLEEIGETVVRAHQAALGWRDQSLQERAQLLGWAAKRLDELIKDKLASLLPEEMEKMVAAILRAMDYKANVSPKAQTVA